MTTRVHEGLVALGKISKSIAKGETTGIPNIFKDYGNKQIRGVAPSIRSGANAVLSQVGINPNLLSAFGINFNDIILEGVEVAENVFSSVVDGVFGIGDIANAEKPLEAVHDLLKNQPKTSTAVNRQLVKHYAVDKSYSNIHPKFKFLYIIQFEFNTDFEEYLKDDANFMAFAVRTASRPTVTIEYEDINMYNFRTKIPKYSDYQPATMTFFDDQSNKTTSFYKKYIEYLIPNARIPKQQQNLYESNQFNFNTEENDSIYNSSSLGALPGDSGHKNIIKSVKLFHIYNWGHNINVYHYFNPKISEINIGDLDMDSTELSEIQITFSYDGLFIETESLSKPSEGIAFNKDSPHANGYDIELYSKPANVNIKYPLEYNGDRSEPIPSIITKSKPVLSEEHRSAVEYKPAKELIGNFPDFNDLLSEGINTVTTIGKSVFGEGSIVDRISNTISAAKSVYGNKLPNISNIGSFFDTPNKPSTPPEVKQLNNDYTNIA